MPPPLLSLRAVSAGFGGPPVLDGVGLTLGSGDRACLVGRNGSGKSTLLRLLAGMIEPGAGERFLQPGTPLAYLPQEPVTAPGASVRDHATADGAPAHAADAVLDALGLHTDRAMAELSGGEARRADLARCLATDAEVLLLDEPTNHLDLDAIAWLEARLAAHRGALVVVSHDRAFLGRVSNRILWLDRGRLRRHDAGYESFEAWQESVLAAEDTAARKLDRRIAEEARWAVEGITARRRRNQGRLRRLAEMRADRAARLQRAGRMAAPAGAEHASGRLVVDAEGIAKAYDGRPVIAGFSTRILRGDRVGVIGANGVGKTTLVRLLIGEMAPDSGRVRLGAGVVPAYLDQRRAALDPQQTPWSFLCDGGGDQVMVGGRPRHVVSYLRDFLFAEAQARQPVSALSGGERNRLLLARALARPSNLLVLDEPTNDLDMDTLDVLVEVLADYPGSVVVVSHDRDFLDRAVGSTIALEGDGRAIEYAGGYSDYLRQRGPGALGTKVEAPRRRSGPKSAQRTRTKSDSVKLSYKEQRALALLPDRISGLEAEVDALQARLADPDLFAREPTAFAAAAERLAAARDELAVLEDEWLALELRREALEQSG